MIDSIMSGKKHENAKNQRKDPLTCFEPTSLKEVIKLLLAMKLILKSPPNYISALDLIPISVEVLLTPITEIIINKKSLKSGGSLDAFKLEHITPLLMKPPLSKDDMSKIRPVSN